MRTILLLLIFCTTFIACQDDDNETISFEKGAKKRVKQITGENSVWGKYRLNFTYDKEGNFLKAWRLNAETGDTTADSPTSSPSPRAAWRLLPQPSTSGHGTTPTRASAASMSSSTD